MTMPEQKPGRSKQDYCTPDDFLKAVKNKLDIDCFHRDLAADEENAVCFFFWDQEQDSLKQSWNSGRGMSWNWCNPPFGDILPWVKKAHEAATKHRYQIAMLVPASVGSNWWRDYVHNKADVLFLNGRLTFKGQKDPYPKDCALLLYYPDSYGYDLWDWRKDA